MIASGWIFPVLALVAALALLACGRGEPGQRITRYLLPAVRTVALLTAAFAYAAALFAH